MDTTSHFILVGDNFRRYVLIFKLIHVCLMIIVQASQMTGLRSDPNRGAPEAIYAIIRVSNVQTPNISWKIYPDPHRLFYEGHLSIMSNGVDVALTV